MLSAMPMTSDSKIEYHHVFPRAKVSKKYGAELTNSIANLAFISGDSNRKIGARNPAEYLPEIPVERLHEQWVPTDREDWDLERFQSFLAHRRALLADVLNEMLGLRSYSGTLHSGDTEVPQDDDEIGIETLAREPARRDVAPAHPGVLRGPGHRRRAHRRRDRQGSVIPVGRRRDQPGAVRARLDAGTIQEGVERPRAEPLASVHCRVVRSVAASTEANRRCHDASGRLT